MKLLKRSSRILASLFFMTLMIMSCNPENENLPPDVDEFNRAKEELVQQNRTSLGSCGELNDIYTNSQVTAANRFKDSFDVYMNCGTSATPYTGNCCPGQTVYLRPGGGYSTSFQTFELWRYWFVAGPGVDYLGTFQPSAVLDVNEQQGFIDRVLDAASITSVPCSGGQLIPTHYELVLMPYTLPNSNTQSVRVGVRVTYEPVCLFSLP